MLKSAGRVPLNLLLDKSLDGAKKQKSVFKTHRHWVASVFSDSKQGGQRRTTDIAQPNIDMEKLKVFKCMYLLTGGRAVASLLLPVY